MIDLSSHVSYIPYGMAWIWVLVFDAIFSNILVLSWQLVGHRRGLSIVAIF
jgi:hypothetical protein